MAIATRRPVWSAALLNDPAFALSPETAATVQTEGYRAVLSVPLVIGTRVLGALVVYRDTVGPFTPAEIELLEIFAAQAVIALENARLFNESSQQRARLSRILELNKRIASRDDMPSLLSSIAEESARLVGADGGSVRILQDDQFVAIGKTHDDSAIDSVSSVSLWEGAAGRCVCEQCVLIIEDIQSHPEVLPAYKHRAAALGLHALVNIPIRGSRGVIGVLTVTSKRSRPFSADEITALSTCAEQAAIAIENAQLLDDIRQQTTNLSQMNTTLQSEVAERQRTETALRESETRYRTLVDGSIQGVFIHHQCTIQFANLAMASIFGSDSPGELIGRDARMLIAPHEVPRVEVYNRQRLQGEAVPFRCKWQGVWQDGQLLWIESVASVVSWAGRGAHHLFRYHGAQAPQSTTPASAEDGGDRHPCRGDWA
jgi:PAS domain S-box-containing protein